jgi:Bacterial TSP3 repeat
VTGTNLTFTYSDAATNQAWDILWKTELSTNVTWQYLVTFAAGQTNLTTGSPTNVTAFFMLGSGADADSDGLSDVVERFVYGTDWQDPDSDNDGLLDGWEVGLGTDPLADEAVMTAKRRNYFYDPLGRLKQVTGAQPSGYGYDNEGNRQSTAP